jgi:hypothetical protein
LANLRRESGSLLVGEPAKLFVRFLADWRRNLVAALSCLCRVHLGFGHAISWCSDDTDWSHPGSITNRSKRKSLVGERSKYVDTHTGKESMALSNRKRRPA